MNRLMRICLGLAVAVPLIGGGLVLLTPGVAHADPEGCSNYCDPGTMFCCMLTNSDGTGGMCAGKYNVTTQ
jgi:hypothetical protein